MDPRQPAESKCIREETVLRFTVSGNETCKADMQTTWQSTADLFHNLGGGQLRSEAHSAGEAELAVLRAADL